MPDKGHIHTEERNTEKQRRSETDRSGTEQQDGRQDKSMPGGPGPQHGDPDVGQPVHLGSEDRPQSGQQWSGNDKPGGQE
jgi:hypothetical protein